MERITVIELKNKLETEKLFVLDVRTQEEVEFTNIGGTHIPLDELEFRFNELDKTEQIFCLCHHGVRSAYAAQFLSSQGFQKVFNIEGGIDAWSLQVDPQIKRY